jgi:hypothetical protein
VLGSVLASHYTGAVTSTTAALPAHAAHAASDSLGGAVVVAHQIGGSSGATILHAAQGAYMGGFGIALTIAAVVAAAGSAVAAIWLPARADSSLPVETQLDEPEIERIGAVA